MSKMTAIRFQKTGHVLGVVTRTSQPDQEANVEQVAAEGFVLSRFDTGLKMTIPTAEIDTKLIDYNTRLAHRPHWFVIQDALPEEVATTLPTVALDGTKITVTLPAAADAAVDAWCLISGASLAEPIVQSAAVAKSSTKGIAPLKLSPGSYQVLVFAPGYAGNLVTATC